MRDVKGYENYFSITDCGQVWSKRSNKFLKLTKGKTGYLMFTTRLKGRASKAITLKVHQLVAKTYLHGYKPGLVVNHKDGNKLNNHYLNLEWVTSSENTLHAFELGLLVNKKGTDNNLSKLTDSEVKFIRDNKSIISQRKLASMFGVSKTNIHLVQNNLTYNN